MKQVQSNTIDAVIEQLDNLDDAQYEKRMEAFAEAQPVVFSYLFSEQFDLLSEDEKGYLQYLSLIIWSAITRECGAPPAAGEEAIGEAEEKNHEIMENSPGARFSARLDPFFENYEQEDLLAFAEEAVMEEPGDDDPLVTKEGREPIFIALKTLIDVLTVDGGR